MDSELEALRKKRLEELKAQQEGQQSEQNQLAQQVAALEAMVKPLFTKDALVRYGTLKTAYPDRAMQLLVMFAQLAQSGQLKDKIDDTQLKAILHKITPKKRETKINRL